MYECDDNEAKFLWVVSMNCVTLKGNLSEYCVTQLSKSCPFISQTIISSIQPATSENNGVNLLGK